MHTTFHRPMALLAVSGTALALGACGGKDDKGKITDIVKAVGNNPTSLCDKYIDSAFLAKIGGKAACEQAAKSDPKAKDPNVKVNSVKVSGKTATAQITGNTGKNTVHFVKQGSDWKVTGG